MPRWQMLLMDGIHCCFGVHCPSDSEWYDEPDGEAEERVRGQMEKGQTLLWVTDKWRELHEQLTANQFPHAWDYYAACGCLVEYNNRRRRLTEGEEGE